MSDTIRLSKVLKELNISATIQSVKCLYSADNPDAYDITDKDNLLLQTTPVSLNNNKRVDEGDPIVFRVDLAQVNQVAQGGRRRSRKSRKSRKSRRR